MEPKEQNIVEQPGIVTQFVLTPAAGKRLIARALAVHPKIQNALKSGIIVIVAGTTNGYVAEEILTNLNDNTRFKRQYFFRGITLPPKHVTTKTGRLQDESSFQGDVVLKKGVWDYGKTIFDVIEEMKDGDIIIKGANAVDLTRKQAAILIGHPKGGTIGVAMQAVADRKVQLIIPVGLEKRILGNLDDLSVHVNTSATGGLRLLPVNGLVFTEIDAIRLLSGAMAELFAAGGVVGAEGSLWLAVSGTSEQVNKAKKIVKSISSEPLFEL